uniref:Regulatory protein zeste n=1 Tax=Glossina pallidipes TaxID=7398 RepID=A0A1B0AIK9_GLOPL
MHRSVNENINYSAPTHDLDDGAEVPTEVSKLRAVSHEQLQIMLAFMEDHGDLAKHFTQNSYQGRQTINKLWEELTEKLNSVGLPNKNATGWRKVWTDYKYRAKRKLSRNLLTLRKAGVLSDDLPPIEEGNASDDQDIKCFAVLSPSPLDDVFDVDLPTVSSKRKKSSSPQADKGLKVEDESLILMKEQLEQDRKFQHDVLKLLKERNDEDKAFHKSVLDIMNTFVKKI